jgi:hypothetical protein
VDMFPDFTAKCVQKTGLGFCGALNLSVPANSTTYSAKFCLVLEHQN